MVYGKVFSLALVLVLVVVAVAANDADNLHVKDVTFRVDGSKDNGADEDGGSIDIEPGSILEIEVELQNEFSREEDIDINDIVIEATIFDIDEDSDIDDDTEKFDLNARQDKEKHLQFRIPLLLEDENYDLILEITGEPENLPDIRKEILYELDVDKENNGLAIELLEVDTTPFCGTEIPIFFNIVNIGEEDEDVEVTVSFDDLVPLVSESLSIQEEDAEELHLSIDIPRNAEGDMTLFITATFNDGFDNIKQSQQLFVQCDTAPSKFQRYQQPLPEVEVYNLGLIGNSPVPEHPPQVYRYQPGGLLQYHSATGQFIALVIANILVLIIIAILLFRFFSELV